MNVAIWVLQVVLAVVFLAHGWLFLDPPASVVEQMNATLPRWFQVFLGVAEIAASIGLLLPGVTRIMPSMVPAAAAGTMIVLSSATVLHLVRGEFSSALITVVLFVLATAVAYMRWRVVPLRARRAP